MKYGLLIVFLAIFNLYFVVGSDFCPSGCECKGNSTIYCQNLPNSTITQLFSNVNFTERYADRLLNLSLVNCSLTNVDFLSIGVLRNLLYLDLSFNNLTDFKFPTPAHFMRLLVVLKLTGNQLVSIPRMLFASGPNVEEVHLDQNRIFYIDWEAFRLYKLKRLWLTRNNLLSINEHILRFTPNLEFLDMSHNQLVSAQSSSFFSARRLTELDLSHNRLQRFDYDSFLPLHQLQILDFSYNNFTEVPAGLTQFVGLRQLNFSANPIKLVKSGDFRLPILQIFVLEYCQHLKLVEAKSFIEMPNIQTVIIRNNPLLAYVSPNAFENNNFIYEIDFKNNSLNVVHFNSTIPSRLEISGNPLECECMIPMFDEFDQHILDLNNISCKIDNSTIELRELRKKQRECSIKPLLPLGADFGVKTGSRIGIYCVPRLLNDTLEWEDKGRGLRIPNQHDSQPLKNQQLSLIHSISMQPFDVLQIAHNDRILHIDEQLVIQTVVAEDEGEYLCEVERGAKKYKQSFKLNINKPKITLHTIDIGSHYVALGWNESLKVEWTENVRLMMAVKDENNSTMRVIQLNILNPWFGYNVLRLRPEKNYTFCLFYEFIYNYPGEIFEACTTAQTLPSLNFWSSLHPSTIFLLLGFCVLITTLTCCRAFYIRFYIWHQTKARSRMNQSISGQSFLSRSTSHPNNGSIMDQSLTYDNSAAVRMSIISTPTTSSTDEPTQRTMLNETV